MPVARLLREHRGARAAVCLPCNFSTAEDEGTVPSMRRGSGVETDVLTLTLSRGERGAETVSLSP